MLSLVSCAVFIILNAEAKAPATEAVSLTANDRSLTYVTANRPVDYDGKAIYTYAADEDLQISCKNAIPRDKQYKQKSTLRLEYYNAAGVLLFQSKPREEKPHVFRSVLKSSNDNYYLDCILETNIRFGEFRTRITFLKRRDILYTGQDEQIVIFSVNGQELTTISHKDPSYDDYIFRYTGEEATLYVTCRKMDHVQGSLKIYSDQGHVGRSIEIHSATISLNVSTLASKTVTCWIDNTLVQKPSARILFLRDELGNDVRLRGLDSNNILYEYTNADNQWTIEYQYSVNDVINVTCVAVDFEVDCTQSRMFAEYNLFKWKFEGRSYESAAVLLSTYPTTKLSPPFTKILDATHNRTKLQCIYNPIGLDELYGSRSVELIFRLKEFNPEAHKGDSTSERTSEVVTLPPNKEHMVESKKRRRKSSNVIGGTSASRDILTYSLSASGVTIFIVFLILCLTKLKRRSCKRTYTREVPQPAPRYKVDNVFYFNQQSIFMPDNEREMEKAYQEIR